MHNGLWVLDVYGDPEEGDRPNIIDTFLFTHADLLVRSIKLSYHAEEEKPEIRQSAREITAYHKGKLICIAEFMPVYDEVTHI